METKYDKRKYILIEKVKLKKLKREKKLCLIAFKKRIKEEFKDKNEQEKIFRMIEYFLE